MPGYRRQDIAKVCVQVLLIGMLVNTVSSAMGSVRGYDRVNMLEYRPTAGAEYQRLYEYTSWVEQYFDNMPLEVWDDAPYDVNAFADLVFRDDVLDAAWGTIALKQRAWIVASEVPCECHDAYLYRQYVDEMMIHICDTRPRMVVAMRSAGPCDTAEGARQRLMAAASRLFCREVIDALGGVSLDETIPKVMFVGRGPVIEEGEGGRRVAYRVTCRMIDNVALFEFEKEAVPGCDVAAAKRLFDEVGLSRLDTTLKYRVNWSDPEYLSCVWQGLGAVTPSEQQRRLSMHVPDYAAKLEKARIGLAEAIVRMLNATDRSTPNACERIETLLELHDRFKNPGYTGVLAKANFEKPAVEALRRIGSPEAAMLHLEILYNKMDRASIEPLLAGFETHEIFQGRLRRILGYHSQDRIAGPISYRVYERFLAEFENMLMEARTLEGDDGLSQIIRERITAASGALRKGRKFVDFVCSADSFQKAWLEHTIVNAIGNDPNDRFRSRCMYTLRLLNEDRADVYAESLANDPSHSVRYWAAAELARIAREQDIDLLLEAIEREKAEMHRDSMTDVVAECIDALAHIARNGSRRALDTLREMQSGDKKFLNDRVLLLCALGRVGDAGDLELLISEVQHGDPHARSLTEALRTWASANPEHLEANHFVLDVLRERLRHEDYQVRQAAAYELRYIGRPEDIALLAKLLDDPHSRRISRVEDRQEVVSYNYFVRETAAESIRWLEKRYLRGIVEP